MSSRQHRIRLACPQHTSSWLSNLSWPEHRAEQTCLGPRGPRWGLRPTIGVPFCLAGPIQTHHPWANTEHVHAPSQFTLLPSTSTDNQTDIIVITLASSIHCLHYQLSLDLE
jgi:hypothetical protein